MTQHVQCPHCGQAYALTDDQVERYAGQMITCTQCNESFQVSSDKAMTGGLVTAPTTFETRPVATAGAMAPFMPLVARGAAGMGYSSPAGLLRPTQRPHGYRETEGNGFAVASLVFAMIGLIVPVIPGFLGVIFGMAGLRRSRFTASGEGMSLGGITLGAIGMVVTGSLMYTFLTPTLSSARDTTKQTQCVDNLRKIGQAMLQYANDHGGHFPDQIETVVATGDLKADLLVCPTSGDKPATGATPDEQAQNLRKGSHLSYTYVGGGITVRSPPECVLAFESPDNHSDGMRVLFVDGRVQIIGRVEATKAASRLKRGINPPWSYSGN